MINNFKKKNLSHTDRENDKTFQKVISNENLPEKISPNNNKFAISGNLDASVGTNLKGKTRRRLSKTEIFIMNAQLRHGNKYDYSKVRYTNASKKVRIICPTHGLFRQTSNVHLTSGGCPYCGNKRLNKEQFIEQMTKLHNGEYEYSKCEYSHYLKALDEITIICKKHGDFRQRIDLHMKGHGCPICGIEKRRETNIKRREKEKLDKLSRKVKLEITYKVNGTATLINISSTPFENRLKAEEHLKDIECFLEIINSKLMRVQYKTLNNSYT